MRKKSPSPLISLYCRHHGLPEVEAIVFDKDGTLADSRCFLERLARVRAELCAETIQGQNSSMGFRENLLASFGVSATGLDPDGLMAVGTRQANQQVAVEALRRANHPITSTASLEALVARLFVAADQDVTPKALHTPPYGGTRSLLERLGNSPIPLAVLSSDSTANVEEFLTAYDLLPWVKDWQGTDHGDPPKPVPVLFYQLCDRLGVRADKTVVIGDSWVDLALAQRAGAAAFISVSEAWGRSPVPGASLVLTSWDDLAWVP